MKRILAVIAASVIIMTVPGFQGHARADAEVSFNLFYESLGPYGYWVDVPPYGYVWQPAQVAPGWMPYVNGYWTWTDAGWTWASYEPWGWATYHYGSWAFADYYGWIWVPGTVWVPAWVVWYSGPGYIGWAPRPPVYSAPIPPERCIFVRSGEFLSPHIDTVVVQPRMNPFILRRARPITVVRSIQGHPFYRGPSVRFVERYTGRRVQRLHLIEYNANPRTAGPHVINRIEGRSYYIYRPNVVRREGEAPAVIRRGVVRTQPRPVRVINRQERPGVYQNNVRRMPAVIRRGPVSVQPQPSPFNRQGRPGVYERNNRSRPVRVQPAPVSPQDRPGVFERDSGGQGGSGYGRFKIKQENGNND
ncbi:MAG: hypothetical protein M1491_02860 [Deltaproteobacteria bacterium]|nr:hypothetical protein [Deltaproteobacteria bacterium]MCL5277692.1 hypothetical protein [Deltaproteobacteria bacterium]